MASITQLKDNPRPFGCLKLTNSKDIWRIRVRDYRIGYSIDDNKQLVNVSIVAPRNAFYPKGATH